MNRRSRWLMWGASVAVLTFNLSLAGCATETGQTRAMLEQKIASARTRADHEGLATWYEQEAKAAKGKADRHRSMTDTYRASAGRAYGAGFQRHCDNLVRQYEQAAEENLALAKLHRQMGAEAKE